MNNDMSADDLAVVRTEARVALDMLKQGQVLSADHPVVVLEDELDRLAEHITKLEEHKAHERKLRIEAEGKWEEWHDRAEAAEAKLQEVERDRDRHRRDAEILERERSDLQLRLQEAERARDALKNWQRAYAMGRSGLTQSADRDFARAEAAEAREAALREALNAILGHTGAPNFWSEGDGCQAREEGEEHENCRPVIFNIARDALAEKP